MDNQNLTAWRRFRSMALAAALVVFLVIVLGGIVRVTGSAGACLDWPTCYGRWTPPAEAAARIDYLHRLAVTLALPLLMVAFGVAVRHLRQERWVLRMTAAALGLLLVQIVLGGWVSLTGAVQVQRWLAGIHLGLSLLVQAAASAAVVLAFYRSFRTRSSEPSWDGRLAFRSPFARLSLLGLSSVFVLMVSGALLASTQAANACPTWPVCSGEWNWAVGINLLHRGVVGLSGILLLALFIQAWRTQRTQTPVLVSATAAGVLFLSQALLGARLVDGMPIYLLGLHRATAVAVWTALVVLVVSSGAARRNSEQERLEAAGFAGRKGLLKDLLLLTKPIVVLLLLVTTYAGMVIGGRAWPSLGITFWTLLGGFMAAGGSGAINQYIDRRDDEKMQRTQKRPIPAGRLTPGEGLAFGVAMTLGAFFLMVAFVNFLAALLSLAGMIYYVLIYSIFLKKTTVQNIVIGGGAGAIPPLVGWAAATGSLNFPSLFLFAVVFMWTPPHFWALALVRRKDYARAGVPMLPVVRGEKETRWQIMLYTLELVGLTLLLPLFGLGGSLYLVGAGLLGLWLISAAWKVWRQGGNKLAWKMYRYSSMYLAFLFLVLMVDALM
jgi:protoheme IX farnesyltransferase